MFSKKSKTVITLTLACSLTIGLISCSSSSSASRNTNIKYSITDEAGEAAELKMMNMPTSPYWFPNQLLEWDPDTDENIQFNKSSIPLSKRASKDRLEAVNSTQNKDFNVVALSIMNSSTSGNPSQGSNKFASNTFSYWQYIDKLVYWGGSSGEGIIVPPGADVIDSAHKNGVPVLGTIFFPMVQHGGKVQWLDEFLQKDSNGNFPMADKLIEVCKTIGFDGWFINEETGLAEGDNEDISKESSKVNQKHAELMQEFIKVFKEKAKDELQVMWYDSLTKDGKMDWQNALTDKNDYFLIDSDKEKVADSMFLNFWWTNKKLAEKQLLKASNEKAKQIKINPYDLYAGIDLQANGTSTPIRWDLFEDENKIPYTSLGLYCPSWTYYSAGNIDEFHSKENRLWVNEFGNPSKETKVTGTEFKGISTYSIEKTAITSLPFNTNFNLGNGYNFFINGEKVSKLDWNNRSLADIMPTYRWIIDNQGSNNIKASIDYANAYYGGNSIKLAGNLNSNEASVIKLFSTDLTLEKGSKFTTTAQSNSEVSLDLILEFYDGDNEEIQGKSKVGNKWTTVEYDISKFNGKAIKSISYKISNKDSISNLSLNLGNIQITGSKKIKPVDVKNVNVDNVSFEEDNMYAGVKLSFDASNKENINNYEIYKINSDNTRTFLGATPNNKYFINALPRDEKSNTTTFEVIAINKNMSVGKSNTVKMEWPDNSIPKANFKASKTLVAPGEEIQFENLSSKVTESVEWKFDGATTESSTEMSPKVKYDKEGTYTVTLTAKSQSGEDVKVMDGLITVSNDAKDNFKNLSLAKTPEASSYVNPNEAPPFAFDGKLDTKWCAVGTPPHNITVDLGSVMTVSEVRIAHAEAGKESPDMNTSDYTIEVSEDGKNFTEVILVKKNNKANTVDTFKVTKAKYVRINVTKPTQGSDSAVRLYEIEVYGIEK
ncbi:endo-beta-N-acetylglucosaminidase [Clostridium sartagoforme AAU1]|uniref:Endo-beta-N-acetylglucosaminidase n=1 Tax=Clostridium sartagoforme AAU1 TaxID=1202534 RepID=R9CG43_9CLOT|nr:discoidin domain-containing protein [Clostridium sartagoforme]EOR27985.1 endo-beta-N-acetylglucosaminidase [Clostridium sartagoforme AAU1]